MASYDIQIKCMFKYSFLRLNVKVELGIFQDDEQKQKSLRCVFKSQQNVAL